MLSTFFNNKKKLLKVINADEAIAYGAAMAAAINNVNESEKIEKLVLVDVCPLSLGTGIEDGLMSVLIKKNTPIPCEKTKGYVTTKNNQDKFTIGIFEGERKFFKDNLLIDRFYINNIRKAPKGEVTVKVTLSIDENSILTVSAYEKGNENNKKNLVIKRQIRDDEEIEKMIEEGMKMREEDLKREKSINEKNKLQKTLNIACEKKEFKKNKSMIDGKVKEIKNWIKQHPEENLEVYASKISEFNNFISKLKD